MSHSGFYRDWMDDIDYAQAGWDYYQSWETSVHQSREGLGYNRYNRYNSYTKTNDMDYFIRSSMGWDSDDERIQRMAGGVCYDGLTTGHSGAPSGKGRRKGKKRGKGKNGTSNGGGGGGGVPGGGGEGGGPPGPGGAAGGSSRPPGTFSAPSTGITGKDAEAKHKKAGERSNLPGGSASSTKSGGNIPGGSNPTGRGLPGAIVVGLDQNAAVAPASSNSSNKTPNPKKSKKRKGKGAKKEANGSNQAPVQMAAVTKKK